MGFTDFKRYCGGSSVLAWLLTVTVGVGVLLWISSAVSRFFGIPDNWISQWFALAADPMALLARPWTIATYIVTHLSPLHLLFNSLWLYWFGRMLADVTRNRSILVLFLGGGITGGIIYILIAWASGYPASAYLTGDSAAVLSVTTATALIMPNRIIRLFLLGEIKLKWIAAVCIVLTLIGANGSSMPTQGAHISGIIFGIVWALVHKGVIRTSNIIFKPSASLTNRKINVNATLKAINNSRADQERLDELLDKVKVSGYESLSQKEKTELNHISSRLKTP